MTTSNPDTLIEQQSKSKRKSHQHEAHNAPVEGIAIPSKIDTRTRRVGLGYSSLQELVFQAAEKTRRRNNPEEYVCMCGLPLGRPAPFSSQEPIFPPPLCPVRCLAAVRPI
jgi:hypothetical protein